MEKRLDLGKGRKEKMVTLSAFMTRLLRRVLNMAGKN